MGAPVQSPAVSRLALIGAAWDRIAQVTSALIPDPENHEVESKIIVLGCKEGLVCHTEIYTGAAARALLPECALDTRGT